MQTLSLNIGRMVTKWCVYVCEWQTICTCKYDTHNAFRTCSVQKGPYTHDAQACEPAHALPCQVIAMNFWREVPLMHDDLSMFAMYDLQQKPQPFTYIIELGLIPSQISLYLFWPPVHVLIPPCQGEPSDEGSSSDLEDFMVASFGKGAPWTT